MKTTHNLKTTEGLAEFMPVEGTWSADLDSFTGTKTDSEGESVVADCFDAIPYLEAAIEKQVGFPVVVQIFRNNGHQINDNAHEIDCGSLLATRATSSEIRSRKA